VPLPSPGDPFLELLAETLENLDRSARGQFLQRFFGTIAQLDLTEAASLDYWHQILERRRELTEALGKPISLKTAMVDVLASQSYLRLPILMEYEDLKKLQINAATDPLTGLYNRRLFEEQFEKELNRAARYTEHLGLVMLDLHRFKEVNDLYGHPRGDALLQMAATTLRKSLRTSDYAFRIGGDEFALLLVQSDAEQAGTLARRLRANFAAAIEPMQMTVTLGLDYGVSVYPLDGDQRETLVRIADERLYEMKNALRVSPEEPAPKQPLAAPAQAAPAETPPQTPVQVPVQTPVQKGAPQSPKKPAYTGTERRKWERVSLAGTRAHAQLVDNLIPTAKVLDLGYGGVALETGLAEELGSIFAAILRVPILPPLRVSLKKLYRIRGESGQMRVGCAFIS
jgi:diguanylate cyclase (GGDEF)-like protein